MGKKGEPNFGLDFSKNLLEKNIIVFEKSILGEKKKHLLKPSCKGPPNLKTPNGFPRLIGGKTSDKTNRRGVVISVCGGGMAPNMEVGGLVSLMGKPRGARDLGRIMQFFRWGFLSKGEKFSAASRGEKNKGQPRGNTMRDS